ncbi:MAG: archaeosortase/exosortase family protein [Pyrinomonadaceae bacterium]
MSERGRIERTTVLVVGLQLAAYWPVWHWYWLRLAGGGGDEAWGPLALLTAIIAFALPATHSAGRAREVAAEDETQDARLDGGSGGGRIPLLWPTVLVLIYAATYPVLPPLGRACVAFAGLGCTLSLWRFGRAFDPATLGLLWLSLPLVPSLQFYGGYPLRALVAQASAPLLRLGGLVVVPEGACLRWGEQLIWIDAPCSGVRMLWAGMFLACLLACVFRLSRRQTLFLFGLALVSIIAGNVWRALALFYLEAGIYEPPFAWAHGGVGVAAFALVGVGVVAAARRLRGSRREVRWTD